MASTISYIDEVIGGMTEEERIFSIKIMNVLRSIADPRTGIVHIEWDRLIDGIRMITGYDAYQSYQLLRKMEKFGMIKLRPFVRVLY